MRYTFLCKPGHYGRPGLHYVYLGAWIRPAGYIVLQHGTATYQEYIKYIRDGAIRIEEDNNNTVRIWQAPLEYHAKRYAETHRKTLGTLVKKTDNIFIGRVNYYHII